jgi:hypothetical protein
LRILGVFDGVGQVIANKAHLRKGWISFWMGGTWIDCAVGTYPTKIDYPHPSVIEATE